MNLAEIQEAMWRATGTSAATHSTTVLNTHINHSYWELQDKVDLREKEAEYSFATTPGTASYSLASLISDYDFIFHVTGKSPDENEWFEILPTEYQNLKNSLSEETYARGLPERYSRWNANLILFPVPDEAYSITLLYKKALGDVGIAGPDIPEAWHEYVFLGALYRFFRELGEYTRAAAIRTERDALTLTVSTNREKERVDQKQYGVKILRQRYP